MLTLLSLVRLGGGGGEGGRESRIVSHMWKKAKQCAHGSLLLQGLSSRFQIRWRTCRHEQVRLLRARAALLSLHSPMPDLARLKLENDRNGARQRAALLSGHRPLNISEL